MTSLAIAETNKRHLVACILLHSLKRCLKIDFKEILSKSKSRVYYQYLYTPFCDANV